MCRYPDIAGNTFELIIDLQVIKQVLMEKWKIFSERLFSPPHNSRPGYFAPLFIDVILYEYPTVRIHWSCLIFLVQVGT